MGGNSNLKFWHDKWLLEGPLRNMIIEPLNRGEDQLQVKDMILNGMWNLQRISFDLPSVVGRTIGAIPIPISPYTLDCISWAYSPSGNFDGKSAYRPIVPNKRIFKHDEPNSKLARETYNLATNFFFCAGQTGQRAAKVPVSVRWNKPELSWYKLNTDGSSIGNPGKAGGEGLI